MCSGISGRVSPRAKGSLDPTGPARAELSLVIIRVPAALGIG